MKIKTIRLQSVLSDEVLTEIMFEIASARAEGAELLRFELNLVNDNLATTKQFIIKKLKDMKQKSRIQFFAAADSFKNGSTEAVFLLNKYPAHFEKNSPGESENYIYVKL